LPGEQIRGCGEVLGMAETERLAGTGQQRLATDPTAARQARRPSRLFNLPILGGAFETFQWVEYLLVVTTYLFHVVTWPDRSWWHLLVWTIAIAAFILIERTEPWFLARGRADAYILLRVALATWIIWLTHSDFISTFLYFVVVANGWSIGRRLGIASALASAVGMFGVTALMVGTREPEPYVHLLPWLAGLGFIGGTTQLARREQEARARSEALLVELTEAHQRLQDYADQASQLATTRERNRLAREIHDSLGHYLTIINVQLETAQALRTRDGARADRAVGEAKRLASEALSDVRRSVAALRPTALENASVREAIEQQVADFREHSGLAVDLAIEGDDSRCSQAVGLALYRAVQEGLTNIRKHAEATHVAVRLRFGPATAELTITDDGRGLPAAPAAGPRPDGGGFGLAGIRERMALLGGTLDICPGPHGGTALRATLPCDGAQ
jgi:signal transduction histidine kinase